MKHSVSDPLIDVAQLKLGMFIHLDLGWMAHPFPLSSFKLSSDEQLSILRGLGLTQVRWSPERSDGGAPAPAPAPAAPISPAPLSAEQQARQAHKRALAAQNDALLLCERQYGEAASGLKKLMESVTKDPRAAGEQSSALTQALLNKMLVDGEMQLRLLTEAAGDKATAHALNVAIIALLLGRSFGLSREDMAEMGQGALLHDMGKMELPSRLRLRDDNFTQAEVQAYQQHVQLGLVLAKQMELGSGASLVVAQHHENADGSGFPLRINVDRMTAAARIVALVNRFDGLCNPSSLARAMTPHEALSLMFAQGRNRFDATMLNAFIRMMGVYPPGSVVQLTDERFALVVAVNSSRPLKPRVLVHEARVPRDEALILNLESSPDLGIRRSLKASQLSKAAQDYLRPRTRLAYFFEAVDSPARDEVGV